MSMMLRYVRNLKKLNNVGRRIVFNHPETKKTGIKHEFCEAHSFNLNLTKSYATEAQFKYQETPIYGIDTIFQNLEIQVNRSGRVTKAEIEKILSSVHAGENISSLQSLLLIRCCGRPLIDSDNEEGVQLVKNVWDTLVQLNIPMDASHYNSLLNVYLEKKHKFSPSAFITKMLQNSIEPNRVTYQNLIASCCQQGDIAGATKILEIMKNKGLPLCENVFNSLIMGHSQANDMENAIEILKAMENAGIAPSARTYEELLCAYAKRGDIDAIKTTMEEVKKNELILLNTQLMEIFYAMAANGHTEIAKEFCNTHLSNISSDIDVSRILVKLINTQKISSALTLLDTSSEDPTRYNIRSISFARAAIKNKNLSAQEIVDICKQLNKHSNGDRIYQTMIYHGLVNQSEPSIVIELMKLWREHNGEIRPHYFWPLLKSRVKTNNDDEILNILKIMINDFKLQPTIETLRDYVIPSMSGTWNIIITALESISIPKQNICLAIASRLLLEKKVRNAGMFMSMYQINYPSEKLLPLLVETLMIRNDPKLFIAALRLMDRKIDTESDDKTSIELADAALLEIMKIIPSYRCGVVNNILNEMEKSGLSISPEVCENVKIYLKDNSSPDSLATLEKLASGTLEQVPLQDYAPFNTVDSSENTVRSVDVIQLRRIFAYNIENKDVERAHATLRQLDLVGYTSGPVLAQAIDLFCREENLEAAEKYVNKLNSLDAAKLDNSKVIKYVTLLIKNGRFHDAATFISNQPDASNIEHMSRVLNLSIRNLFDVMIEANQLENIHQMIDILKSKKFMIPDNTYAPVIKYHISNNNLEQALEVFERSCMEYKCTPYKNVLAKAFINNEDANSLQKLTDLSTEIHGETNSLIDLAFAFFDCNRIRQAQKILETSDVPINNDRLTNIVNHFVKLERYDQLGKLVQVMKGVTRIDRGHLYMSVLDAYDKINDWESGLGLWTEMQEDDIQPTAQFLGKLSVLIDRNGQKVPFVHSDLTQLNNKILDHKITRDISLRQNVKYTKFMEAISRKDYDLAENILKSPVNNRTQMGLMYGMIIKSLFDDNEIDKGLEYMKKVIKNCSFLKRNLFVSVTDKLIALGRNEDIKEIGSIMEESLKESVYYYKQLSKSIILSDGLKSFIENFKMDTPIDNNQPRALEFKIHFGAMVHGLIADPSYLPAYIEWANKMNENMINRSMHVLWNYYFIKQLPEAEKLWDEYVSNSSAPLIRPIMEYAKNNKDIKLMKQLVEKLDGHPRLSLNSKCNCLVGIIDVYNQVGRYDDALKTLEKLTTQFSIKVVSREVLDELKAGLERSGKTFPYHSQRGKSEADKHEENVQES
ncbi:hypothetical protein PV327_003200 [Microctonus hyperodae]|uniref:Pentatricopeptide repeat-containing protein-mitochondrial domain-containing protein n=1 Tax=Microctonus hyperodae TaxID=165561 RepID=A0AA39L0N5_MICHY|nr:hypothetical protein PV327_003200 [Microctonus hyperodae]